MTESVVDQPGKTQQVKVMWPIVNDEEFEELVSRGMLWEFYGMRRGTGGLEGELYEYCAQLVGDIAPLWEGQQGVVQKWVLFCNPRRNGCPYLLLWGMPREG